MKLSFPRGYQVMLVGVLRIVACAPQGSPVSSVSSSSIPSNTHLISASSPTSSYPQPTVPIGTSSDPFASVDGRLFQIQSKTEYFAGVNTWWLGHLQDDDDVINVINDLTSTQLKVARVWGFGSTNDSTSVTGVYYQLLNSSGQYFNFDSNTGIPRLDYAVSTAEMKGVKLVIPLVDNWDGLGGINDYTAAFGGTHVSWFTDYRSQEAYKAYISLIVNRYKASSAIFAWELANEPRCHSCPTSVITEWAANISAYIKSLDPRHMVALGDEGWMVAPYGDGSYVYSGIEGLDFVKNIAISTIDYGTFHAYPQQWGYNNTWVNEWIMQHDQAGRVAGKPVVLEEYGSVVLTDKQSIMKPWQDTVLFNTSVAADFFWQLGANLSPVEKDPFDGYTIKYNNTPGSDYEVLASQHAAAMLAKQSAPIK